MTYRTARFWRTLGAVVMAAPALVLRIPTRPLFLLLFCIRKSRKTHCFYELIFRPPEPWTLLDNRLWGAPHIHGELLKLGFAVAQSTIAKYMAKPGDPSGQRWSTFLRNHTPHIAAMDLFVVPTISFVQLYVLVIVRLARRELVSINVTAHPTAEWIAHQITEAFPWNEVPRYLIRDRDGIYGAAVTRRLRAMGIRDKPIAPGSPWQNGYVERLIGTIRRECLDHMIVFGEAHLRRILGKYAAYYNESRIHHSN
jgi:transposase InsO family protein